MNPVVFYLLSITTITSTSILGLYYINKEYSKQNFYPNTEIVRGTSDKNEYTLFTLPNQMNVLLITNNQTEISAADMRVETGFMQDPVEFKGMAHFIEHMLVLGSQKYPQENLYKQFLSLNAGYEIGITSDIDTNFYFQVQNSAFSQVLDQFSRFFIDPLFNQHTMDREIQSIHSEWKNSLSYKDRKIFYLIRILSKDGHPFGKFSIGNLQTLIENPQKKGLDPYIQIRKSFRGQYSANRMNLVLYTHEKMGQRITELIFEYFQQIMDKQLKEPTFHSYGKPISESTNYFVRLHTDSTDKDLIIFFNIESLFNIKHKSLQFITYTLMNFLEPNFCVEQLNAHFAGDCQWYLHEVPDEFSYFIIKLKLTKSGKKQISNIIRSFMMQVKLLSEVSEEVLNSYYQNYVEILQVQFDFKESLGPQLQYIKSLASNLNYYFGQRILIDQTIPNGFYFNEIKEIFETGINTDNLNMILRGNFAAGNRDEEFPQANYDIDIHDPINMYMNDMQCDILLQAQKNHESNNSSCKHFQQSHSQQRKKINFLQKNQQENEHQHKKRVRVQKKKHEQETEESGEQQLNEEEDHLLKIENTKLDEQDEVIDQVEEQQEGKQDQEDDDDDEVEREEEIFVKNDFNLQDTSTIWETSLNEFKYNYLYDIYHLESNISRQSLKKLKTEMRPDLSLINLQEITNVIPTNFTLQPQPVIQQTDIKKYRRFQKKSYYKYPELIDSSLAGNLWVIKDTSLKVPKIEVRTLIKYFNYNNLDKQISYSLLFLYSIRIKQRMKFDLEHYLLISMENLNVQVVEIGAIEISYTCYSQFLEEISIVIVKILDECKIIANQQELNWLIELAQVEQQEDQQKLLYEQAISYLRYLLSDSPINKQIKLKLIKKFNEIADYQQQLLQVQRWDVLMYGNIDSKEAKHVWNKILKPKENSQLQKEPLKSELPSVQILKIAKHPLTYRVKFPSYDFVNSVTVNYYQGTERNLAQYTYMKLLINSLNSYSFDYLRTQLQLGYIVKCQILQIGVVDGIAMQVQSSNYDPEEIDFYIEECLGYYENYLYKLQDKDFSLMQESLMKELQQSPSEISSQADLVWQPIRQGDYYFTMRECMSLALEKITKYDLIKFYQLFFKTRNSKFSLQLYNSHSFQTIPNEVLRAQDTYSRTISKLIKTDEEVKKELTEFYKYSQKFITEAPEYAC